MKGEEHLGVILREDYCIHCGDLIECVGVSWSLLFLIIIFLFFSIFVWSITALLSCAYAFEGVGCVYSFLSSIFYFPIYRIRINFLICRVTAGPTDGTGRSRGRLGR